ncbi:MAG: hypothetical protein V4598_01120 [Bdellovibrionota bacterium]
MARKVANGLNKRQPVRSRNSVKETSEHFSTEDSNFETGSRSGSSLGGRENYGQLIRELISNPAVKYVAGGIAASILSRIATNMSTKYPEVSKFLRENIDSFEGRLGQYRSGLNDERESRI